MRRLVFLIIFALLPTGCSQQQPGEQAVDAQTDSARPEQTPHSRDTATDRPIEVPHDGFVSSHACLECHESEHKTWHQSYHRTMTQVVSPKTALGNFDGRTRDFYGWRFRPEQRDDELWMNLSSPSSGKQLDYKLVLSTGSHHMQKFWYHTGKSRKLGLAPLIYLRESQRWVPEHTAFLRPTEPALPLREGTWNKGCNQCHATGAQPRITGPDEMDTLVAEFGISCEACHGPGEKHIQEKTANSIVNPRTLTAERSSQVCGQCHGAWLSRKGAHTDYDQVGNRFRPGDDLFAYRFYPHRAEDVELHTKMHAENSFWPDGQNRVAGREFNGLIDSPCFTNAKTDVTKMTCISCHDMHNQSGVDSQTWVDDQLGKTTSGNAACLQCHNEYRANLANHTHHPVDSAGSLCYNCHMPYTSYGLLKAVRAHKITSPSVEESVKSGRPNACNQCHLDQTLAWTNDYLSQWYQHEKVALPAEHQSLAASVVWALKGDAAQRAIMAWSMGWREAHRTSDPHWMVFFLTNLMFDEYDAIRYIAHRSLKRFPGFESLAFDHLQPQQERSRVMDEVMSIWTGQGKTRPTQAELLFTPQGEIRFDLFQTLLQQQDKRQIVITE